MEISIVDEARNKHARSTQPSMSNVNTWGHDIIKDLDSLKVRVSVKLGFLQTKIFKPSITVGQGQIFKQWATI